MAASANNGNWGLLLKEFHEIESKGRPLTKKQTDDLKALSAKAGSDSSLTTRQSSGIVDRVNNVLAGLYGVKYGTYQYKGA